MVMKGLVYNRACLITVPIATSDAEILHGLFFPPPVVSQLLIRAAREKNNSLI